MTIETGQRMFQFTALVMQQAGQILKNMLPCRADIEKYAALQGMILKNMPPCRAAYWHLCNIGPTIMILLILHPRPWDTGKVAALGPY